MSGSFLQFAYYLVLAFIIGTLAQVVTGYKKRPLITTLVLGFLGVWAGDFLAFRLHFPHIIPPVFGISLVWSTVGATLFILGYGLLRGKM
jgi:uncharacterized membrane protein YeaQ/YmgE (transglycosylase-associated protein family)